MWAPEYDEHGYLVPGVHSCSVGRFMQLYGLINPHRTQLAAELSAFLDALRQHRWVKAVYIDGSFVSRKDEPSDIDVAVVFHDDADDADDARIYSAYQELRDFIAATRHARRGIDPHLDVDGNYTDEIYVGLTLERATPLGVDHSVYRKGIVRLLDFGNHNV